MRIVVMKFQFVKKLALILLISVLAVYIIFLILPFLINPIIKNYSPQISEKKKKNTGLNSTIFDLRILTTPKLTVGVAVKDFGLISPDDKNIAKVEDFKVKLSLLPILAKKIEVDVVQAKNLNANIVLKQDGTPLLMDYLPKTENVEEVCRIISAFGTGITGFKMVDVSPEKVLGNIPKQIRDDLISDIETKTAEMKNEKKLEEFGIVMRSARDFFILSVDQDENVKCKTIKFSHGKENVLFNISEESDGTIRILDLLEVLLSGEGKTYVIDELDRCLHPSLTYKFVDTFLQLAAKKNLQLIVTTHESRLLDFDLLRRDEIWFINKRKSGESDIYSLEEYNARFDQKIDKAYLEGRYGGVPVFSTVFPIEEEV